MALLMHFFVASAVVAVITCSPQYNQASQDQVGAATGGVNPSSAGVIPTHASDGSILTDEQREALQQFWWKVEGVFGAGGNTAEGVSGVGGNTAEGAKQCGYSSDYDCVPHFQCINGVISTDGEYLIDIRTKPQGTCINSENPDVIAVCCLIPGGTATPSPLESCYGDDECVEPYLCSAEGEINTDGGGLIDIRLGQTTCYIPDKGIGVCCKPPKNILDYCPTGAQCVEHGGCLGKALDAADAFVHYVQTGSWQECSLEYQNTGVCCKKYLENCPQYSLCVEHGGCLGKALNAADAFVDYVQTGSWQECALEYNSGVCCKKYLDNCPQDSLCVDHGQCLGTALDSSDAFIDYSTSGSWQECSAGGIHGVCCKQPVKVVDCIYDSVCLSHDKCYTTALGYDNTFIDYNPNGKYQECYLGTGLPNGVCCSPPAQKYVDCPLNSGCVEYGSCLGTAMNPEGAFSKYDVIGIWAECSLGPNYPDSGVCCIAEEKIDTYPPADKCGVRNYNIDQRIQSNYALNEAAFGEFPWQSIIFYQNYTFKCGASLISNKHAITAAHCLKWTAADRKTVLDLLPGDIKLRFGEWQVSSFDEPYPYQDRNVYKIYIHPGFNPKNVHNDIAVLELIEPIPLQYHVNTICLPSYDQIFYEGHECIATGWGKDSFTGKFQHILKKIELPYVDHTRCQDLLRKTRLGRYFELDDSFVCAGGIENKDACYGDGGGPLVCKDKNTQQYVLAGITSWGIGCGSQNVPGVYADVKKFSQWVDDIVLGGSHQVQGETVVTGYGK